MKTWVSFACVVALAGSVGAQPGSLSVLQQPPSPTGNGVIEGTVINEVTREPVRKAQVIIGSANALPAVTDATGRFVFRNLGPGTFWLQASHPLFPQPTRVMQALPVSVTLGQDEQKHNVVITLTPGAAISGRVLDEDEKPLAGCGVQALEFQLGQPTRKLIARNTATSDSRGHYRISGLPGGRYYLMVQCQQTLPAPHPFIRSGPDVDVPQQRYTLEFYPSLPEASGAGRFTVAAGADSRGIDFRVRAAATVTVRGRFSGDLEALLHNPWVQLFPRDPVTGNLFQYGGMVDARRNTFRIDAVPAGRYTLVAVSQDETRSYLGQMPIDIGAETPAPIELAFLSGSSFTGAIESVNDQPQTPENAQVRLVPMDSPFYGQAPFGKVEKDRTFALSGVLPGRWRLQVDGMGYVKSFTVGDRPASPHGFNIGPGSGGVMRIVIGAKLSQIEGTVTGTKPEGATNLWLMAVPDDPDRITEGSISFASAEGSGHFTLAGLEPGKYRLYAFASIEPSAMQQNPGVLKSLEGRGVQVELEEGAHATTEVQIIPIAELLHAFDDAAL